MKRFCSFLFLFFCFFAAQPQNLIADWSAEDLYQCPDQLGFVESFLNDWTSLRGSPDYFHSCCELPQLCWNNSLGYQEPRTGEGYLGIVTYSMNLPNYSEYAGVNLIEPMEVGASYYVSFHAALAFRPNGGRFATDKLGFLLMTENYLNLDGLAPKQNFSHYYSDVVLIDTTNWTKLETTIVADSAYSMIAFGCFFEDDQIEVLMPYGDFTSGVAYYYLDDFCVSQDSTRCETVLGIEELISPEVVVFPNPAYDHFIIESTESLVNLIIFDSSGRQVLSRSMNGDLWALQPIHLSAGIYLLSIETKKGNVQKRLLVSKP